jgi:hypothetical protein
MITTQQLQLLKEGKKKLLKRCIRAYNARIYSFCPFYDRRCRGGKGY